MSETNDNAELLIAARKFSGVEVSSTPLSKVWRPLAGPYETHEAGKLSRFLEGVRDRSTVAVATNGGGKVFVYERKAA